MEFNHLHFYVDDLAPWRQWFLNTWRGHLPLHQEGDRQGTLLIYLGKVPLQISDRQSGLGAVTRYLQVHPPGIGDMAFRVRDLDRTLARLLRCGGKVLIPIQPDQWGRGRWCQIQGWGSLHHTLVESHIADSWVPGHGATPDLRVDRDSGIDGIDHAVINVPQQEFSAAVAWYVDQLGFEPQQWFRIETAWSGLHSQVLASPDGNVQLPINEPVTPTSQVQEFLHWNQGAGIQHVALHTSDIFHTVRQLKQGGVGFIDVPTTYYQALHRRQDYQADRPLEVALDQLKILVDWETSFPHARLLQTFTQPLLDIPTLFFEVIQRQVVEIEGVPHRARGFGEQNFQALFEAIEQEQLKRQIPSQSSEP